MQKKDMTEFEIVVEGVADFALVPKDTATAFLKALEETIVELYENDNV